jgi:hypothetical protein
MLHLPVIHWIEKRALPINNRQYCCTIAGETIVFVNGTDKGWIDMTLPDLLLA